MTLTPRFLFKNNMADTISVRQEGSDGFIHLGQGERGPMHRFMKRPGGDGNDPRVVIAFQGLNEVWCVPIARPSLTRYRSPSRADPSLLARSLRSAPFNITEIGRVHVTLPRKNPTPGQSKSQLVRIEIIIEGPALFVHLSEETDPWPFKIQNETDEDFQFGQTVRVILPLAALQVPGADEPRRRLSFLLQDVKTIEGVSDGPRKTRTLHTVHPFASANYTWELPAETNKRLKIIANGRERLVDVMEIGVLAPFRFTDVSVGLAAPHLPHAHRSDDDDDRASHRKPARPASRRSTSAPTARRRCSLSPITRSRTAPSSRRAAAGRCLAAARWTAASRSRPSRPTRRST